MTYHFKNNQEKRQVIRVTDMDEVRYGFYKDLILDDTLRKEEYFGIKILGFPKFMDSTIWLSKEEYEKYIDQIN